MTDNALELKNLKQILSEAKNSRARAERVEHDLRDYDLILSYVEHERALVALITELEDVSTLRR